MTASHGGVLVPGRTCWSQQHVWSRVQTLAKRRNCAGDAHLFQHDGLANALALVITPAPQVAHLHRLGLRNQMDTAANSPCLARLALTYGHTFRCCTTTATSSPPITPPALLWQICGCGVFRSAWKRMNQGKTLQSP